MRFRVDLYNVERLDRRETFARVWQYLAEPPLGARSYDSVERTRRRFSESEAAAASDLFDQYGSLFVRGHQAGALLVIREHPEGFSTWKLALDIGHDLPQAWQEWILRTVTMFPVLYGLGCVQEEYDAKHMVVSTRAEMVATGLEGVATADFLRFLPGIYWLTIFGKPIVDYLGPDRLLNRDDLRLTQLDGSGMAAWLPEPAGPVDLDRRLQRERVIAADLDSSLFYDREARERRYQQAPQVLAAIEQARQADSW